MPTPLEQYRQIYLLGSVVIEEEPRRLIVDQHQKFNLDLSQPVYLLDLDHTLLKTNDLKDLLSRSLSGLSISADQFQETYQQAKDEHNFYDFHRHLELLSAIIAPVHPVEAVPLKIQESLFTIINKEIKSLVYDNLAAWLQQVKPRNILIDTSGTGEWQRQKVAACLNSMNWQPQAVLLIENAHKGWVIDKLYQLIKPVDDTSPQLIVVDDNPEEVADMAEIVSQQNIQASIFRMKQPGGQYNDSPTPANKGIIELDVVTNPKLDLVKELAV